jgi:hypothetical protein
MSDAADQGLKLHAAADADVQQYRPVSGWAVAALLLGLLSPLAFVGAIFWLLPVLGVAVSVLALRQFSMPDNVSTGRSAALVGLALGLVFGTAAPAAQWSETWLLKREARSLGEAWFAHLAAGQPAKAAQLAVSPNLRRPLDDKLWDYYRSGPEARKELEDLIAQPHVRTLLALGPRAKIRFYETGDVTRYEQRDLLTQYFAVTRDDQGRTKTFFVRVLTERSINPKTKRAGWQIMATSGGVRPTSLGQ